MGKSRNHWNEDSWKYKTNKNKTYDLRNKHKNLDRNQNSHDNSKDYEREILEYHLAD